MSVERHDGEVSIYCDCCGEGLSETEVDVEGFEELLQALKDDKWWVLKVDGHWTHTCPDCQ